METSLQTSLVGSSLLSMLLPQDGIWDTNTSHAYNLNQGAKGLVWGKNYLDFHQKHGTPQLQE